METWKLLAGLSVVLVVFGAIVATVDVDLSSPLVLGVLIFAVLFSAISYTLGKRGYERGKVIGEAMREDDSE